jgi:hypothetical protein
VTGEVEALAVGGGVGLVRWHGADAEQAVERGIVELERAARVNARETGFAVEWRGPEVIVFDSVEPGVEQKQFDVPPGKLLSDGALRVPFAAGRYLVRLGMMDPAVGGLSLVLLVRG